MSQKPIFCDICRVVVCLGGSCSRTQNLHCWMVSVTTTAQQWLTQTSPRAQCSNLPPSNQHSWHCLRESGGRFRQGQKRNFFSVKQQRKKNADVLVFFTDTGKVTPGLEKHGRQPTLECIKIPTDFGGPCQQNVSMHQSNRISEVKCHNLCLPFSFSTNV